MRRIHVGLLASLQMSQEALVVQGWDPVLSASLRKLGGTIEDMGITTLCLCES